MPTLRAMSDVHELYLRECIDACSACHEICVQTLHLHCLHLGGKYVKQEHVKLMTDCADISRLCADFMIRGSRRHALTCRVCADICEACAYDCERIGGMEDCVDACRRCARTCREAAA